VCVECLVEDHEMGLGCGAVTGIHNQYRLTRCIVIVVRRIPEVTEIAVNTSLFLVAGALYRDCRLRVRAHLGLWHGGWVGGVLD